MDQAHSPLNRPGTRDRRAVSFSPNRRRGFLAGWLLAWTLVTGPVLAAASAPQPSSEDPPVKTWKDVEQLRVDQQFRAALEVAESLRRQAEASGDAAAWTRGLIIETQLNVGLQSYETAILNLRRSPWPEEPRYRAVLQLFYARSLVQYLQRNSWEIRQRERLTSPQDTLDISLLTGEQIYQEALRAYAQIWPQRDAWGQDSLGELAEYIEQNTYPARIRGTWRDAVSYLWVELLADTSHWTPTESNELWRLDFDLLLEGEADASSSADATDPSLHPLHRLTIVLGDLETWHHGGGRPEAAFEARLERLRRLADSFSEDAPQTALREHLQERLEVLPSTLPWHAMGRYLLAGWHRRDGDLVAARDVALSGALAHPKAVGGTLCRGLVDAIEAADVSLSSMALDGAGRRSLQLDHRNLERLHFRAYRVHQMQHLKDAESKGRRLGDNDVRKLLAQGQAPHQWTEELPPTPDYHLHRTFVTPPMKAPGQYVVVTSTRADFSESFSNMQAVSLTISDLVVSTRGHDDGWEVMVRSGRSGEPLADVQIVLYQNDWRQGPVRKATATTDGDGRVHLLRPSDESRRHQYLVVARHGSDLTIVRDLSRFRSARENTQERALIYTDRSVYRPGQTIHWKVVVYGHEGERRQLHVAPQRPVTLYLNDANGEEIASLDVETNDFGSAAGSFEIPSGRLLGSWSLRSEPHAYAPIRVEEYKRPTFEVTLEDPAEALRLNQPAQLQGRVRYYFGLPVSEGEAVWRVLRQPVYPPWWGWYFRPAPGGSQTVAMGSSELAADGTFSIDFDPQVAAAEGSADRQVSYSYRVEVDVTNEGGETRSAERSFRLGHVAVEAQVEGARAFFVDSDKAQFSVRRRDLDGLPRAGVGRWTLLRIQQPDTAPLPADQPEPRATVDDYRTEGDDLRPRWADSLPWRQLVAEWPDGKVLRHGELQHGVDGAAELTVRPLRSGVYRLRYTTEDAWGAEYATSYDFIVAGEGCDELRLPILLMADRASAEVGETVRVLAYSGLEDQDITYSLHLGNERRAWRRLHSGDGMQLIELPIDAAMRGNVAVQLELVRDHQALAQQLNVEVPWSDRQLQIELATFRDLLRPGQEETWKVILRGAEGEALEEGAAELLTYMYDRSLDLFQPHTAPQIGQLYQRRVYFETPRFNLGTSPVIWRRHGRSRISTSNPLRGDRLKFYDEYVGGGPGFGHGPVMKMRAMPQAMALDSAVAGSAEMESRVMAEEALESPAPPPPPPPPAKAAPAPAGPADGAGLSAAPEVRSNFAETAFWLPQLRLEADGAVSFTFEAPDSVTEWNLWLHAMTRDLRSASQTRQVKTVKELLVRPYLPRFFRQMDAPELRVVIDNAGEQDLAGHLDFELFDAESELDLAAEFGLTAAQTRQVPFQVAAGRSTTLTFPVTVPKRLGEVALRVVGRAGDWSDGELRPLPILPSRLHLSQSRFVTLHDADRRELHFADMAADDDTTRDHEQLVVTIDGQLFYSVLHALPYLVQYPYACSEQTLNRFVSTGIVSSLYGDYPAVAQMAKQFAERETVYEGWDDDDPNRKMLLEETPWLQASRGGKVDGAELINVLDPAIAEAQRLASLEELRQAQTAEGGFPWWSGGPPSPYITTYVLMGLSRALEFGVDVPQDMVQAAWTYLHRHYRRDMVDKMVQGQCCVELATYLNFVLSSYPDMSWTGDTWTEDDRRQLLDASWRDWRRLSPLLKGYLTLTLSRSGRADDARLVWESVMDSARQDDIQGVFWAPEERAWLWYNDSVEGHAFALRVLNELAPEDPRRHGLVQWLLLNKKLNHWKSTRATAEVLYSLVHYLQSEGGIAQREEVAVKVGRRHRHFVFEPETYSGRKNQWRFEGKEIEPQAMSTVTVEKETPGFLFASATWHYATDRLPEEARGDFFNLERRYFLRRHDGAEWRLDPLTEGAVVEPGDQMEVHLILQTHHAAEYVHLRDPRGAGFEPMDLTSGYRWDLGLGHYREIRDSGSNFFIEWLPAGEYTLKYRVRASLGGKFRVAPATVQSMYAPELVAFSAGHVLHVTGRDPSTEEEPTTP